MNNKIIAWGALLILFLIIMNIVLIQHYKKAKGQEITARVVDQDNALVNPDPIFIAKNDLKSCCTFVDGGKTQTCYVMSRFDCAFCQRYCSGSR